MFRRSSYASRRLMRAGHRLGPTALVEVAGGYGDDVVTSPRPLVQLRHPSFRRRYSWLQG